VLALWGRCPEEAGAPPYWPWVQLMRRWIALGMPMGKATDPTVARIEVYPPNRILNHGMGQQLSVTAHYTDGSSEDVTRWVQFQSNEADVADVEPGARVETRTLAGQAAISIQNARLYESLLERERLQRDLKIAEQVQKRFLPQEVPSLPGYEFFAHYEPAYEVGGDYYDFAPLPTDRLAIALGDVSGKGVSAALMMAKFSGDTRYCILTENSPGAAATELNSLLFSAGIEEKFITLSLSVLDHQRHTLTLASAGHMPVAIRRADGTVEEVGEAITGFPLGIVLETEYEQVDINLEPGDVAVIYSDGVPDSRNLKEELFDSRDNRRLLRRLADTAGSPEVIGRAILQDIREYAAGHVQVDDITLICLGRLPLSD